MKRIFLFASLVILCLAIGTPAFACNHCKDNGICSVQNSNDNTECTQEIEICFDTSCSGALASAALADQLTIASVDVVTPAGTSRVEPARVAEHTPAAAPALSINR